MMFEEFIIVKIGGKILENPKDLDSTISQLNLLNEKNIVQNIVIIPGGGSYANFVRIVDDDLNIGDELSHWIAIYAMNQNGIELKRKYPQLHLVDDLNELFKLSHKLCIFLPFNYLFNTNELPHSWDCTSDSITLHLANKLELDVAYLIKDIDGIENDKNQIIKEISTSEYKKLRDSDLLANIHKKESNLKKSQPIDSYLLRLIDEHRKYCIILNGTPSNPRILDYFSLSENKEKIYTKISFD